MAAGDRGGAEAADRVHAGIPLALVEVAMSRRDQPRTEELPIPKLTVGEFIGLEHPLRCVGGEGIHRPELVSGHTTARARVRQVGQERQIAERITGSLRRRRRVAGAELGGWGRRVPARRTRPTFVVAAGAAPPPRGCPPPAKTLRLFLP